MISIIYKYPLYPGTTLLQLPPTATPLSVQLQEGAPVLYVEFDPNDPSPKVNYRLRLIETGKSFERDARERYLGTLMLAQGQYVIHAYGGF